MVKDVEVRDVDVSTCSVDGDMIPPGAFKVTFVRLTASGEPVLTTDCPFAVTSSKVRGNGPVLLQLAPGALDCVVDPKSPASAISSIP